MNHKQVVVAAILATILFYGTALCFADDCQDPSKLDPQMQKAYYQLKEASKQLGGFSVSIRCTTKEGYEKAAPKEDKRDDEVYERNGKE
jgi:hypothetical protein